MDEVYYEFRLAKSVEELQCLLVLRKQVFKNSRWASLLADNNSEIDIDAYDPYSLHFGLFKKTAGAKSIPCGYLRIVQKEHSFQKDLVADLYRKYVNDAVGNGLSTPPVPLPMISYLPDSTEAIEAVYHCKSCEGSRLSLVSSERSLALTKICFEGAMSFAFEVLGVDLVLITCAPAHEVFYSRFGYTRMPGTKTFKMPFDSNLQCVALVLARTHYVSKKKYQDMALAFRSIGQIHYNPSNPYDFISAPDKIDSSIAA